MFNKLTRALVVATLLLGSLIAAQAAPLTPYYSRVFVNASTVGTGDFTLTTALSGNLTFAAAGVPDGATVRYLATEGTNSEIGHGVVGSSGTTLTRNVDESIVAGVKGTSKVSFTGGETVTLQVSAFDFNQYCSSTDPQDISYTGGATHQQILFSTRNLSLTGHLTTGINLDLPAASTYPKNCELLITDGAGFVSASHTATVNPNGTDTIANLSSYPTIPTKGFALGLVSDGVSNWAVSRATIVAALGSGQIYVGDSSNRTAPVTMSGDATIDNTGAVTVSRTGGVLFGTAATQNTGGSGATIPLNNGTNTHSGTDDFTGTFKISGKQLGLGTLTDTKFCIYTAATHTLECNTSSTTGSIEVTDGTTDLTAAAKITFTGCVVSGTNPNASVNCTGGGGILAVASGGTNAANGSGAAKNLSHPYVVCDAANTGGGVAATTVSGTTTETIIWQCKIPAGLMTANGRMSLLFQDAFGGALSANSKSLKFYFGTLGTTSDTSISSASLTTISSTASGQMGFLSILSQGSTSSQWLTISNGNANILTGNLNATSFNMATTPIFLTVTGTLSSAANSAGESIAAKYTQLVFFPDGGN